MRFASRSLFFISVLGLLTSTSAKPAYRPRREHENYVEPIKSLRQFDPRKSPTGRAVPAPHHTRLSKNGLDGLSSVVQGVVAGIAGNILRSEPDVSSLSNANSNILARGHVGPGIDLTSEGDAASPDALDTSSGVSDQAGVAALNPASLGHSGVSTGSLTSSTVSGVSGGTSPQNIAAAIIDLLLSSAAPHGVGSDDLLAVDTTSPTTGSLIPSSISGGGGASPLSVVDGTTSSDPTVDTSTAVAAADVDSSEGPTSIGSLVADDTSAASVPSATSSTGVDSLPHVGNVAPIVDENLLAAILALAGSSGPHYTASDTTVDPTTFVSNIGASPPASESSASTPSIDNVRPPNSVDGMSSGFSLDTAGSPVAQRSSTSKKMTLSHRYR